MGREVEGGGLGRRTTTILGVSGAEQIAMATTMSSYPASHTYLHARAPLVTNALQIFFTRSTARSTTLTSWRNARLLRGRNARGREGRGRGARRPRGSARVRHLRDQGSRFLPVVPSFSVMASRGQPAERASSLTADIAHRTHLCTRVHPARRSDAPAPASGKNQNYSSTPRVSRQWVIHRDQYVSAAKRRETKETIHSLPVGLPRIFHHHL
ncbi:hypothetical protein B0H16DRAFT_837704 [Mycena metata]|uniref:Uncharacterized protein n=1 Tax=Mycena metata TaxID=1033252 RepID=A0AAD7IWZ7_9AGAR|nr:hypothetical protein B0H16DRAFT_837704 [Mycena metata]